MTQEDMYEHAWPYLAAAIQRFGPTHSKDHVWQRIVECTAQLHALPHSGMVTTIETYPTGLKELRFWLAGGDKHEIRDYVPMVEAWGKEIGCHQSAIYGRRGWHRVLIGYRDVGATLVKEL